MWGQCVWGKKPECRVSNFVTRWVLGWKKEGTALRLLVRLAGPKSMCAICLVLALVWRDGFSDQRGLWWLMSANETNFREIVYFVYLSRLKKIISLEFCFLRLKHLSYLMFYAFFGLYLYSDWRPSASVIPVFVFRRYEVHPVCAELQAKILQCYRQNAQQTLSCSALASQYMRCVNQAKEVGVHPLPAPVEACPVSWDSGKDVTG